MKYRYVTADVFTEHAFGGNQLAVLPDARGLSDEQMLAITREFGYSESVFVLPPEHAHNTRKLRIFTPGGEVPFAGHPTVGTAFALAELGELDGTATDGGSSIRIVFEEGVGPVSVTATLTAGHTSFCELTAAQLPEPGPPAPPAEDIARMLSLPTDAVGAAGLKAHAFSCGVPFLFVPLESVDALSAVELQRDAVKQTLSEYWAHALFAFAFAGDKTAVPTTIRARMFAPLFGIDEDPATGAAASALPPLLLRANGELPADGTYRWSIRQGVEMGRASSISLAADVADGAITAVHVGGPSVLVADGMLEVPRRPAPERSH